MKPPKSSWLVVGASLPGKSHLTDHIPCQDAHKITHINKDWGVAIVCDGAGSCEFSHLGSAFLSHNAAIDFKNLVIKHKWHKNNILPEEEEWKILSSQCLFSLREKLLDYSSKENHAFKSLSSTIIVLIYSPIGLLISHIGDGRAGYCNTDNQWFALINPYSGHQVGTTVFITADIIENQDLYIESRVIRTKVKAFTLLTDGCELSCWECYQKTDIDDFCVYPNNPYPNFFNPNVQVLLNMHHLKMSYSEISKKWNNFVDCGNAILKEENDDKTIILGVLTSNTKT